MKKYGKIIAIGLSCAMAFSLAACGGDDPDKGNSPDPDKIKTEQVTEAQWKSAMNVSDVTNVTVKTTERYTVAGVTLEAYDLTKYDGGKIYCESMGYESDGSSSMPVKVVEKEYYSVNGSEVYRYTYDDATKKWSKGASTWYPEISDYTDTLDTIADNFAQFTYNSAKGAYIASELPGFDDDLDSYSVKIVGGKLSVVQMDASFSVSGVTMTGSMIFQIYDYGTTSVTLPKEDDEQGSGGKPSPAGQVTEAEWNAALSANTFSNVSITMSDSRYSGYDAEFKIDLANRAIYQSFYGGSPDGSGNVKSENIVAWKNGDYRLYSRMEGEDWEYGGLASDSAEDIAANVTITLSAFEYSSFTYESAAGLYVAHGLSMPMMDGQEVDVEIKFRDGKLAYAEVIMTESGETVSQRMSFSDYGRTVIQIPDASIPEDPSGTGEQLSQAEWENVLSVGAFDNCTMTATANGTTSTVKWDKKSRRASIYVDYGSSGDFIVVVPEGENMYRIYINQKGTWTETTTEQDMYATVSASGVNYITAFVDRFDKFRYEKATGEYIANNIAVEGTEMVAETVKIRIKDGKLYSLTLIVDGNEMKLVVTDYGVTVIDIPEVE